MINPVLHSPIFGRDSEVYISKTDIGLRNGNAGGGYQVLLGTSIGIVAKYMICGDGQS